MDGYRLSVFLHIVFSILLVGLALFWIIMQMALGRRGDAATAQRLLDIAQAARWPHVAVPQAWRLPLPWLTWGVILALCGTGVLAAALGRVPEGPLWWAKLALVAAIIVVQATMTGRARPALYRPWFALVLAAIPVSGWVLR